MAQTRPKAGVAQDELLRLVYELLDAHDDTARLMAEPADAMRWKMHLEYLRDLQRVGRGLLAHATAESDVSPDDLALEAARAAVARTVKSPQITIRSTLELPPKRG